MKTFVKKFTTLCQKVGAFKAAPSQAQGQAALFTLGIALLSVGLAANGYTQDVPEYNDTRIAAGVGTLLSYLEGSFGALVMVASGIGAILSSAFGQYRAALGCLVVAVGAFILRGFLFTFFNTESVSEFVS